MKRRPIVRSLIKTLECPYYTDGQKSRHGLIQHIIAHNDQGRNGVEKDNVPAFIPEVTKTLVLFQRKQHAHWITFVIHLWICV